MDDYQMRGGVSITTRRRTLRRHLEPLGGAMSDVLRIDQQNFDAEVPTCPLPVLLDFSARWCGSCTKLAPVVEELARRYAGRLKVVTIDLDESPDLASRFRVMAVPTLLFLREGRTVERVIGTRSLEKLATLVDKVLSDNPCQIDNLCLCR
jgi:thioredoxin 1